MGCSLSENNKHNGKQKVKTISDPIVPPITEGLVCKKHNKLIVKICIQDKCTKPLTICESCTDHLTSCKFIQQGDLVTTVKNWQSNKNQNIKKIQNLISSYFNKVRQNLEKKLKEQEQLLIFKLETNQLQLNINENEQKIFKSFLQLTINDQNIKRSSITQIQTIMNQNRKQYNGLQLERVKSEIQQSIKDIDYEINKIFSNFEISHSLYTLVKLKKQLPKQPLTKLAQIQSKIINNQDQDTFRKFMSIVKTKLKKFKNLRLLYRASEQAFSASKFHILCNEVPNTIVLIKTTKKLIFGGYTTIPWMNSPFLTFFSDNEAQSFLFSVTHQKIYNIKKQEVKHAICCDPEYGPIFGKGYDIIIQDKCNESKNSRANIGKTYESTFNYMSLQCQTELAGEKQFTVSEYQIWALQ